MKNSDQRRVQLQVWDAPTRRIHRKKFWRVTVLTVMVSMLTGCNLALEEAEAQEEDILVGIFLTNEYLDVGVPELEVNSRGEITFKENTEGIPGKLISDEYGPTGIVFEGIEGYGIYSMQMWDEDLQIDVSYVFQDDIFSDVCWTVVNYMNSADATVYVGEDGDSKFYFNPVYRTPQGEVYLQPGNGMSLVGYRVAGASTAHTLSWEETRKEGEEETKKGSSFTVHVTVASDSCNSQILFMDKENRIIEVMAEEELEDLWKEGQWGLEIPSGTAYLLLEQEDNQGNTKYTAYSKGEDSLKIMRSLEKGYLVNQSMDLIWK